MIFSTTDYKEYLRSKIAEKGRGARSRLAEVIRCKPSYIAQILNGNTNLSLEQAEDINQYLGHTDIECSYFISLVLYERAGSESLRQRLFKDVEEIRSKAKKIKNRVSKNVKINSDDLAQYYSSWVYIAVHGLCHMDKKTTAKKIAKRLRVSEIVIEKAIQFLISAGLLEKTAKGYIVQGKRTHLDGDSPLVIQHHTNFRTCAIRSFEAFNQENLHYTSVVAVSEKERLYIKELITQTISEIKSKVGENEKPEVLLGFNADFFEI